MKEKIVIPDAPFAQSRDDNFFELSTKQLNDKFSISAKQPDPANLQDHFSLPRSR
jgi:hypothetical protein